MSSDDESEEMELDLSSPGVVTNDMGCHIDGFIAVVLHTHVLQEGPVTGRAADVIAAANTAAEVTLMLVRPGKKVDILCMADAYGLSDLYFSENFFSASIYAVYAITQVLMF
ncbi:hypothetical protein Csa_017967 [Cucumis sativus]|nr:hypothetical protein Csa_017967 [Cucumis sativus]